MSSGETVPVVACQHGPGVENLFGAIAQAYSEGVPMVVVPAGYARNQGWVPGNFNSAVNFQHVAKHCEQVTTPDSIISALRRAFSIARQGRPGPVVVEVPIDYSLCAPLPLERLGSVRTRSAFGLSPRPAAGAVPLYISLLTLRN